MRKGCFRKVCISEGLVNVYQIGSCESSMNEQTARLTEQPGPSPRGVGLAYRLW